MKSKDTYGKAMANAKTNLSFLLLLIMLLMTGCDIGYMNNPQPEPPPPKEYEVLSVIPYIEVDTNGYGAVLSQDLGYAFTYIDENGVLHNDTIYHTEYGIWKVCIGEENKYIVEDKGFDTYRYLYLTEEILKGMNNYEQRN
jgi:hypothetical protein